MRALIPAAVIAVLAYFVSPKAGPAPLPEHARDLRLVLSPVKFRWIEPGEKPWVEMSLENGSRRYAYPVVKPGDGSEVGWRQPHIFFTATLTAPDGTTTAVPVGRYGRCGLFDFQWHRTCLMLKPGERLSMAEYASPHLEFQQPGRVQLRAHYKYSAPPGRSRDFLGMMAGVAPFEVVSDPVEFEVRRSLDVQVKVKRAMKANVKQRLSELLEVVVLNRTASLQTLAGPRGNPDATLQLQLQAEFGGWAPHYFQSPTSEHLDPYSGTCYGIPSSLQPESTTSLLGEGRLDGVWEYPKAQTVKVRAAFRPGIRESHSRVYYSEWVDLQVEQ